jgi:predicted CopG family antitoxin
MENYKMIRVHESTYKKLQDLKVHPRASMNEVIDKLIVGIMPE